MMKNFVAILIIGIGVFMGCGDTSRIIDSESEPGATKPGDNLPHAKLPNELRGARVLELDIGQSVWIAKWSVHIDEKNNVWVNSETDVDFDKPNTFSLRAKRVTSRCVELILPRSHQKENSKVFIWTPRYIGRAYWKVSVFAIEEDE